MRISRKLYCSLLVMCSIAFAGNVTPASAFTDANANTLMNSFNSAFYSVSSGNGYYKNYKSGGDTGFWQQAEIIETLESAYARSGSSTYKTMITEALNGFSSQRGTSWSGNIYNDDIMWACIAYIKGYELTGNTTFRTIAKNNFDMCYARAWDTSAWGLWWTTAKTSKNSCVQGPGAIAAYRLYLALGDSTYLTKSQKIVQWWRKYGFNESNGQVYDSPSNTTPTTYNQGVFINANYNIGSTGGATLACNYLMTMGSTSSTSNGYKLMPVYGNANNNSGLNGIAIRWAAKYMKDMGMQSTYLGWLQANAQAAWDVRRDSDLLSWQNWHTALTNGDYVGSWDCVNSVAALQVVPPTQ